MVILQFLVKQRFLRRRRFAAFDRVLIFQFADALKNLAAFPQSQLGQFLENLGLANGWNLNLPPGTGKWHCGLMPESTVVRRVWESIRDDLEAV